MLVVVGLAVLVVLALLGTLAVRQRRTRNQPESAPRAAETARRQNSRDDPERGTDRPLPTDQDQPDTLWRLVAAWGSAESGRMNLA
ncbi:hypothetical protein [Actinoalloteichus sp. GBA129-24]|uniref:hypothetical protein n=1 Tax=Actinoalloteichus sp. GBA129-24 TaxID=1612551 RepID=UPI00095094EB|nr:hypothetical protein [Actinoalloteichus sp. GBA129-24]APU21645.1 hypothetical protein UA75_18275 [Actinoalloteichus sp. GBA129-24]